MRESSKPLILVSNDDGYQAKGLRELLRFLRPLAQVIVLCPDSARSGTSMSISIRHDVSLKAVLKEDDLEVYVSDGTPSDCVKLAFYSVLGGRLPDLVISGINHGDNASTNVHYSGTMGAVKEGCLKGIPSIGFSLCDFDADADFSPLEPYIQAIVRKVLEKGLPPLVCLNVNFPPRPSFKGVKVTTMATGYWVDEFRKTKEEDGVASFLMVGDFVDTNTEDPLMDHHCLNEGWVTVTPTLLDVSSRMLVKDIKERLHL